MSFKDFFDKIFNKHGKSVSILDFYPDAVLKLSEDAEIIFANKQAQDLFEMSSSELKSKKFTDIFDIDINPVNKLAQTSESMILKSVMRSGEDKYVEIKASGFEGQFVITMRDVTKNHKMVTRILVEYESLKKVNKDKNSFLTKISNELKAPLHSITGFSQALLEGLGGKINEKQDKYLKIINKNSTELLNLMEKILELSKIEAGLYEYDYKSFDVVDSVVSVISAYKKSIDFKKSELIFDSQNIAKRACWCDEMAIKAVVANLLENAIYFTDGGSINIKISHPSVEILQAQGFCTDENIEEKSFVMFSIKDTGCGYGEDDLKTLFDVYSQVDKGNKKDVLRGLRLGISKLLIKNLKGKLWAVETASQKDLKGSEFNFIIPSSKN